MDKQTRERLRELLNIVTDDMPVEMRAGDLRELLDAEELLDEIVTNYFAGFDVLVDEAIDRASALLAPAAGEKAEGR